MALKFGAAFGSQRFYFVRAPHSQIRKDRQSSTNQVVVQWTPRIATQRHDNEANRKAASSRHNNNTPPLPQQHLQYQYARSKQCPVTVNQSGSQVDHKSPRKKSMK